MGHGIYLANIEPKKECKTDIEPSTNNYLIDSSSIQHRFELHTYRPHVHWCKLQRYTSTSRLVPATTDRRLLFTRKTYAKKVVGRPFNGFEPALRGTRESEFNHDGVPIAPHDFCYASSWLLMLTNISTNM